MNAERMQQAIALYESALALPAEKRASFVAAASAADPELRANVELLLEHGRRSALGQTRSSPPNPAGRAIAAQATGELEVDVPVRAAENGADRGFAGYAIVRELNRGGQGIVYEAMQTATKRKVAIKVLLEGQHASEDARRRFQREVELVAQFKHPNIISVFHTGASADGHPFYVMDFVDGERFGEYVRSAQLSLEATLELFATVCDAVQHAHQKGVIHLDLKPSNVLIDQDGVPKVLDFGLAKPLAASANTWVSTRDELVGTLPYLAPEQAGGGELDTRSDVYSLGVILYELLTGHRPYPVHGRIPEVIRHICESPPTPLARSWTCDVGVKHRSHGRVRLGDCPIDSDVEGIVMKALAKEPRRRYQSVGELARDIRHYLAGEPIEARSDSVLYVLWKQSRRYFRRRPAVVLAALCAILAPGFVVALRYWREAVRERDVAEAVIEFLNNDVFQPLDPQRAGRAVDLKELLDAATGSLDTRFADAPLAEASIRHMLGNLYNSMGEGASALVHLERAIEIRRGELGAKHAAVAESLISRSHVLESLGRITDAEQDLHAAHALRAERLGPDHPQTLDVIGELAGFARRRGDLERAEQLLAQASNAGGASPGQTPAASADEAQARALLSSAVEKHGDNHPEAAAALVNLADTLVRQGARDRAEPLYLEAMKVYSEHFGSEHPRVRAIFAQLEELLIQLESVERMVPLLWTRLERALADGQNPEWLSSAAWDVGKRAEYPAELYALAQRAAEAACRIRPHSGSYANTLGVVQYRAGQFSEAMHTLLRADWLNGGHPADVAFLAMAYQRKGDAEHAAEELARLKQLMAAEPWASDRQSQRFFNEAQALIASHSGD